MDMLELDFAYKGPRQGCRLRDCDAEPSRHAEEVHPLTKTQGKVADCAIVRQSPVGMQKKYTQPGLNWRPSACYADVIATRPWVLMH